MSIKIGDNNKIKKSTIIDSNTNYDKNTSNDKSSFFSKHIILSGVLTGVLVFVISNILEILPFWDYISLFFKKLF